ncbi:energy transducer TonB [Aureispira sp. CCB-E]|uniref:energy transducer TonB n=1 Tax=Aureispira sp. CCB-E TaxID=3051121 RepID=UPI00286975D1|nr:energy transducer TonB [Aureispira sp. CCB-E]WMX15430.1 energy transducer TonB [Aureispira sp. CCB-E]
MNTLFATSTLILSGGQVLLGFAAVGVAIYLGIFATKTYMNQQALKIKTEGNKNDSPLVRKYAAVDIHQHTKNIKLAGFASAVAVVLIAFAWTQFTSEQVLAEFFPELEEIEMEVPPTSQDKPKLPPALPPPAPKPALTFEPTDEPEPEPEKPEEPIIDVSPTPSTYTGPTDPNATELPPVIAIEPEPEPEEPAPNDDIILVPDQMPRFPGCEEQAGNHEAKKACADKKLLSFIYENIKYPSMARDMGIEGLVAVSLVINKDGSVGDIKILRDPGGGLGKETIRIIKLMNKMPEKWTPGKQRGRPVRVRYNLPVRFKLND